MYTTLEFLYDRFPFLEKLANAVSKKVSTLKKNFVGLVNTEYEGLIINIIIGIPLFCLILFFGFLITVALLNTTEPERGYKFKTILTSSMSPSIKPGSVVLMKPPFQVSAGDTVSFNERSIETKVATGRTITHRVVDVVVINGVKHYVTKGDGNNQPDPGYITNSDIVGEVFLIIPYLGYLSFLSFNSWGIIVFILVPAMVLAYTELKVLTEYLNSEKRLKK